MNEAQANFGALMGQIDTFLFMTVSLALAVGIVGIINTMLMSTTERFVEFGVLRTNGWSQVNILSLVTLESAYLGLLVGLRRLFAGMARRSGRQPIPLRGYPPGHVAITLGSRHRPVCHHGDFGWTLSCVACCSAGAHGGHSLRVALIQLSVVSCPLSSSAVRVRSRWHLECRVASEYSTDHAIRRSAETDN